MTYITTWTKPPVPQQDQASRLRAMVRHADRAAAPPVSSAPPAEQAAAPALPSQPEAPKTPSAWTLAIASGKGGVGKSNIAVNLALAFAETGLATTLLDGDLGLANADLLLGLRSGPHLGEVLDGSRTLDQISVRVAPKLTLIPGASGVAALATLDERRRAALRRVIGQIGQNSQLAMFDCGAGIGTGVLSLMAAADRSLVVTTPEPTAIADAYALIKCVISTRIAASAPMPSLSLIVNQARDLRDGQRVHARIAAVCDRFLGYKLPLAGVIEFDERVRIAVRERSPFVLASPQCAASKSVRSLCGLLTQQMGGASPAAPSGGGGMARIARMFGWTH